MKNTSLAAIVVCSMAFLFALSFNLEAKHHHHHHHHNHHHNHHKHHNHHHHTTNHKHHHHHHSGVNVTLQTTPTYTVSPQVIVQKPQVIVQQAQVVVQKPVIYPATTYLVYQEVPAYDYYLTYGWYWVR